MLGFTPTYGHPINTGVDASIVLLKNSFYQIKDWRFF